MTVNGTWQTAPRAPESSVTMKPWSSRARQEFVPNLPGALHAAHALKQSSSARFDHRPAPRRSVCRAAAGVTAAGFEPTPDYEKLAAPLLAMAAISSREQAQAFAAIQAPGQSRPGGLPLTDTAPHIRAALEAAVESSAELGRAPSAPSAPSAPAASEITPPFVISTIGIAQLTTAPAAPRSGARSRTA